MNKNWGMKNEIEKCNEWHEKAMLLSDKAFDFERKGSRLQAREFYSQAFDFEKKSALLLLEKYDVEPSRSVLFRSAAWLAFNAEEYRESERMAAYGLSGNAPESVATELREVMEKAIAKIKATHMANAA